MEPQDYSGSLKKADELRVRTKKFAIRIVLCFDHFRVLLMRRLSESKCCVLGHLWQQTIGPYAVLDPAEFISKMSIVVEGADETVFWLEVLTETGVISATKAANLQKEANELLAIFSASLRTSKRGFQ